MNKKKDKNKKPLVPKFIFLLPVIVIIMTIVFWYVIKAARGV